MSKPNAGAHQVLKTQVKSALDNYHAIIDECKKETAENALRGSKGESNPKAETSEEKERNKKGESGMQSRASTQPEGSLQSHSVATGNQARTPRHKCRLSPQNIREKQAQERRTASGPTAFNQSQRRPKAFSYVPRRLEDLPAAERDA